MVMVMRRFGVAESVRVIHMDKLTTLGGCYTSWWHWWQQAHSRLSQGFSYFTKFQFFVVYILPGKW
jgi:hypothetical protein